MFSEFSLPKFCINKIEGKEKEIKIFNLVQSEESILVRFVGESTHLELNDIGQIIFKCQLSFRPKSIMK